MSRNPVSRREGTIVIFQFLRREIYLKFPFLSASKYTRIVTSYNQNLAQSRGRDSSRDPSFSLVENNNWGGNTHECSKIFLLRTLEALYRTIIEFRIIFPLGSRFSRCKSWRCNRVTSLVHQARPTFVPNFLFSLPSPFRKKSKIIIRQLNSIFRKLSSID